MSLQKATKISLTLHMISCFGPIVAPGYGLCCPLWENGGFIELSLSVLEKEVILDMDCVFNEGLKALS